jgi:hypothetical protein
MSEHDWFEWRNMTCCRKCGIVKRSRNPLTGKRVRQSKCKGEVQITLRQAATDLLDAIDERHSTEPGQFKWVVPWDEARILALAIDLEPPA